MGVRININEKTMNITAGKPKKMGSTKLAEPSLSVLIVAKADTPRQTAIPIDGMAKNIPEHSPAIALSESRYLFPVIM
jgi:hypothetical protein